MRSFYCSTCGNQCLYTHDFSTGDCLARGVTEGTSTVLVRSLITEGIRSTNLKFEIFLQRPSTFNPGAVLRARAEAACELHARWALKGGGEYSRIGVNHDPAIYATRIHPPYV